MDFVDIKKKTKKELNDLLAKERQTLHALRAKAASGQLKEVANIKKSRTQIARLMTRLNQLNHEESNA